MQTSIDDLKNYLPYAGTSGWSGSETSRERAEDLDKSGITIKRQQFVLSELLILGKRGITWRELDVHYGHHGISTALLSVLHKAGVIERLSERRSRCSVYVLPEFVYGRETQAHGHKKAIKACSNCGHEE
jgi:hypothetical protein